MCVNYFKLRHDPSMCIFVCMTKHDHITLDSNVLSERCKTIHLSYLETEHPLYA